MELIGSGDIVTSIRKCVLINYVHMCSVVYCLLCNEGDISHCLTLLM